MKKHDVGVLFVHGIGEQSRGDTLLQFAEPLVRWINDWLTQRGGEPPTGEAAFARARLLDRGRDEPAHATVHLTIGGDAASTPRTQTWMLAEARWAEDARTPKFDALAGWLLTTGSWIILSHALRPVGTRRSRWRWLKMGQALVVALLVTILLQLTVVVLVIAAAIPIPSFRAALSRALLRISGTIGDSYVLVESELQRQAIITTTQESLNWLAGRCARVVVIAHSQGAAVAHRVLRHPHPPNVSLFLSYGSGLAKLEELLLLKEREHTWKLTIAKYATPGVIVAAIVAIRIRALYWDQPFAPIVFFLCLAPVLLAWLTVSIAQDTGTKLDARFAKLSFSTVRPGLRWLDIYSTDDPVPNGPLTQRTKVAGLITRRVSNLRSMLADHTAYWANHAEFIPIVAKHIGHVAGVRFFSSRDARRRIHQLRLAHGRRVQQLAAWRWIGLATTALAIGGLRNSLEPLGRGILQVLQLQPIRSIGTLILDTGRTLAVGIALVTRTDAAIVRSWLYIAVGATAIFMCIRLWYRGVHTLWLWTERVEASVRLRPATAPQPHPMDRKLPEAITAFAAITPLAFALVIALGPAVMPASVREAEILSYFAIAGALRTFYATLILVTVGIQLLDATRRQPWRDWFAAVGILGVSWLILESHFLLDAPVRDRVMEAVLATWSFIVSLALVAFGVRALWLWVSALGWPLRLLALLVPAAGSSYLTWVYFAQAPEPDVRNAFFAWIGVYLILLAGVYAVTALTRRAARPRRATVGVPGRD